MALTPSRSLYRGFTWLQQSYVCPQCRRYATPSTPSLPSAPPLLLKLRKDLKTAMQEKDKPRLNVLRNVLAEVTNAAKTNSPIKTDMQLLSLLRKRAAAAKTASEEFKSAGRQDLVEQEEKQAEIMEEYAGSVQTMGMEQIKEAVSGVVEEMKAAASGKAVNMGDVLKKLLAPGGSLDGKAVERSEVARMVKEAVGTGK
ncbi:hypothetical protein BAUCODRAFT_26560 [Baudoinia panamericana UAMH 10762]|uniref:Altered inheritance of mitochondria protein 41 n=1 Tax=Baudoinia panamericana (strain UAMH 10762) TaxID=717646 RepID=M2M9V8_BAUPA|nr:uncharacterized protein BAUCODRAFT_26560 [Baudoinia panamericana UAMH 10762]EMC93236.1 hypothetical protein BAUCODRAFT_26560 [Baudoinia panamericana UAMH 10762]